MEVKTEEAKRRPMKSYMESRTALVASKIRKTSSPYAEITPSFA
jgi:hypothetical protein